MPEQLLEVLEWNGTALVPLTILEAGDNAVVSVNLCINPSGAVNADGYSKSNGTGGISVLSRQSGAGVGGPAGFIRATWTTAASAGGGLNVLPSLIPDTVPIGGQRTVQARVRTSKACTVSFGGYIRAATSAVSPGGGSKFALAANTWTLVSFTTPAATAAGDNVYFYAYFDGAANAPGVGDFIDLDLVMASASLVVEDYFDGDTVDTIDYLHEFTGPAHASRSLKRDARGGAMQALIVT